MSRSDELSVRSGTAKEPGQEGSAPRQRPSSRSLLASELKQLFRRRRTQALLLALAAIPVLIAVVVRLSSAVPPGRGPA